MQAKKRKSTTKVVNPLNISAIKFSALRKGYTVRALCRAMGVTTQGFNLMENKGDMRLTQFRDACEGIGIDPYTMLREVLSTPQGQSPPNGDYTIPDAPALAADVAEGYAPPPPATDADALSLLRFLSANRGDLEEALRIAKKRRVAKQGLKPK